jgi:hypothetical protein
MKGRWPPPVPANPGGDADGDALPPGWKIESLRQVVVPGLAEERNILVLRCRARR